MALLDDINRLLRDHTGYSGDGQGGSGPLPVGDRSTARLPIIKRDLRELLFLIAQTVGDPDALQDIFDQLNDLQIASDLGDVLRLSVSGTPNAMTATRPPGQSHITDSLATLVSFVPVGVNTAPNPTIQIEGGEVREIRRPGGGELPAGALVPNRPYLARIWSGDPQTLRLISSVVPGDIVGLEEVLVNVAEALVSLAERDDIIDGVAGRADSRSAVLVPYGDPTNPEYIFSVGDGTGNQLMGYHIIRKVLDLGFPLSFGPQSTLLTGDEAEYLFSIEDAAGDPIFAIGQDGTVYGGEVTGSSGGGGDVQGFAAMRAANEAPILDDDEQTSIKTFTTAREIYTGVPFRGLNYVSGEAGAGVDVGWLPLNGEVNIELGHNDAYIYSSLGFAGSGGINTLTRTPGVYTVVRVFRISGRIVYTVMTGSVVQSTTTPIRDRSIVLGGQSHAASGFRLGIVAGLLDGMANMQWRPPGDWMPSPVNWTPYAINGATGNTAISSIASASCWWNHATGSDGPALIHWKEQIADAIAAGQPVPEDVIWAQGESDCAALTSGTLSMAVHWEDLTAVFEEMRAHLISLGATDPQFYIGMLGRGEDPTRYARARGYTAVRQNYLRLIAETAWVHYACETYDLPGVYQDVHYSFLGSYTFGYRFSRAVNNVHDDQSNSLGPQVTAATMQDGGRSVRLAISGSSLRMPTNPANVWIIPPGGDAQSPPIPATRVRVDGNALVVTAAQDLTGCRIIYPWGAVPNPRGDSIVYDIEDVHVKMPGLPLRTFITDPLS